MKPEDANSDVKRQKTNSYLQTTLLSRLEDKKDGAMILVQQRLHVDDTTGHVLDMGKWDHLNLPAIATTDEYIPIGDDLFFKRSSGEPLDPIREDLETLEKIKFEVGSHVFSAQWQQLPTLPGGNMLKLDQFRRYEELPPRHFFEYYVQSWDPAVTAAETSDYSVCTTWGKRGDYYYLIDVFRQKLEYPDLKEAVQEQFIKHAPRLVIFEGSHIGHALYAEFDRSRFSKKSKDGKIVFTRLSPKKSKEERAAVQAVKIEQGRVFLPIEADWLEIFENEIRDFPVGKYDDQVDSMVQFLMAMDFRIPWVNC
jgi:predicted phage terminase large subunit-like protein